MARLTAAAYRALAKEESQKSAESFQRCDTDGCVSQWCNDKQASLYRALANLADNDWKATFMILEDLEGNKVNAKLIQGKYGMCWAFCDGDGNLTGKFISAFPKRRSTLARKGYQEAKELAPAYATLSGSGTGLSGLATLRVVVFRTDNN